MANELPTLLNTAYQAVDSYYLPRYSNEECQKSWAKWGYSWTYVTVETATTIALFPITLTCKIAKKILQGAEWVATPLLDQICPISHINGRRHILALPRRIESFLGDWVFTPFSRLYTWQTNNEGYDNAVQTVFQTVADNNAEILNPEGLVKFNYTIRTVDSRAFNAFCAPGGGMVIYTGLIKEIDRALAHSQYNTSEITLADGTKVSIALEGLTREDVLAAIIGHEITHAASRHSFKALMYKLLCGAIAAALSLLLDAYTFPLMLPLKEKLVELLFLFELVDYFGGHIQSFIDHYHSRHCEYESDIIGVYMANRAGYDPRAALLFHDIILKSQDPLNTLLRRATEFKATHPFPENRKRAIFAAMRKINPDLDYTVTRGEVSYDPVRSSPAVRYGQQIASSAS